MSRKNQKYTAPSPMTARTLLLTLAFAAALALLAFAGHWIAPSSAATERNDAPTLAFSEVMTANGGAWAAPDGGYHDWVELKNASDAPISTEGWKVSDSIDLRGAFALPARTLAPNERMLVVCAGPSGAADAAQFTLSKDGASLFLIAPNGAVTEALQVPPLKRGEVYATDESTGEWLTHANFTPGSENTLEAHLKLQNVTAAEGDVVISEIMAANRNSARDADGDASDWIELYNASSAPVDLTGWSLTTDLADRRKWVFPECTLQPNEYRIVFASGKNRADGELHTNFRLSADGERICLIDAGGRVAASAEFGAMGRDQSVCRRSDGVYSVSDAPSPGRENTAAAAFLTLDAAYRTAGENAEGLYINEISCSTQGYSDWIELYNASSGAISLTGWGLSDGVSAPKWHFPEGASIASGEYLIVFLNGDAPPRSYQSGRLTADFALSMSGGEFVTLFRPDGTIADAVALPAQRGNISYGRADGHSEYRYFPEMTPGAANAGATFARIVSPVAFSQTGGMIAEPSVTVALTAESDCTIRYTLDGSEPNEASPAYAQPFTLSQTTVIRAKAFAGDAIPSVTTANTYLFGESTQLRVVCVSGDPSALIRSGGILKTGAQTRLPVSVEVYDYDGTPMVSQVCEIMVTGANSRTKYAQKGMRFTARSAYGDSRFRANLFTKRGYADYKSFSLRASGQDSVQSHMRDSVLSSLAEDTSVFYQETELAALYVDGQYWGMYNMREHIDAHSLSQFEGWTGAESELDILRSHRMSVEQGSKDSYNEMMAFVRRADFSSDATIEKLRAYCDIENYLDYVAFLMYVEQEDLSNVRVYRNPKGDGLWRWAIFDLDFSFSNDKNSAYMWLAEEGHVNAMTQQDNTLFYRLMRNDAMRDAFLRRMGQLMATTFSPKNVIGKIEARYNAISAEMKKNCERWDTSYTGWQKDVKKLADYASTRTEKLISYIQNTFRLTDAQVETYFGDALRAARA